MIDATKIEGSISISFKNVTFKYPSSQSNVLENINLDISKGETVAIVGKSGSGKTTLLDLIPRLYDPDQGDIYFNTSNIKDINLNKIRAYICLLYTSPSPRDLSTSRMPSSA